MDRIRFARSFRALRIRVRMRQVDVQQTAAVPRSAIQAIEAGRLRTVQVGDLIDAAQALGADVDIRLRWQGEALDRLLDEAHAQLVDRFVKRLASLGWRCEVEVSFNVSGERGSIDILAWQQSSGTLVVIEVKSVVPTRKR